MSENLFPVFNQIVDRKTKEEKLQQHSVVLWFTGLSSSGKTTLACSLEKALSEKGFLTQVLDGDNIRSGICGDLQFSTEDRVENIRRVAEISKLLVNCGVIVINSFISPTEEIRKQASLIIGEENFFSIFVDTSIEVCEKRDVKGLYKKARAGLIKDFTGLDAPFEKPLNPFLHIRTETITIDEGVKLLLKKVLPIISY